MHLLFACRSPFTKTMEITKTAKMTKTTQTATIKELSAGLVDGEALKGLYLQVLLSKHRSIACPLPLALASDLPCGVCTCKWDLQLLSPGWLWTDFPRPRGWRVTTALGNPFPCGKVCFWQKAPLVKPPLRFPEWKSRNHGHDKPGRKPQVPQTTGSEIPDRFSIVQKSLQQTAIISQKQV